MECDLTECLRTPSVIHWVHSGPSGFVNLLSAYSRILECTVRLDNLEEQTLLVDFPT